jgi:F-type H+-transporting ATPase subunit b
MKCFRLLSSLMLGATLATAPLALRAQEHEPAKAEQHETKTEGHEAKGEAHQAGHEGAAHEGAGHEGGEHGGAHHGIDWKAEIFKVVNFALFAAGIWFMIGAGKKAAFEQKAKDIEHQLQQAERDKAEGEAQIRDLEARMAGMQKELEGIVAKAEADAEAEKARVIEAAKLEAEMIVAQAGAEIAFKQKQAELELRALVAQLASEAAAKRIEMKLQGGAAGAVLDKAIREIASQGGVN